MNLANITPILLTFDEAPNIQRTLEKLAWAREVLVVDSFSKDDTLDIARRLPNVRVIQRAFDSFAGQCNFALQLVTTQWVLSLDADYLLSGEFNHEVAELNPNADVSGFSTAFTYCIHGRPLRACLYPPRVVLYRKDRAHYRDEGHGHRVQVDGKVEPLNSKIFHDDRKPLVRWLSEQNKYAVREAEHLVRTPVEQLKSSDRIRRWILPAPFLIFFYTLLWKRLILDGWPGWYYVFQRTYAELLLSLHLLEEKLKVESRK